jgi:redox-sensitive bicupin YhaK (pirin superfamily)
LHIERPPESLVVSGGLFHGIQLWVNLPAADKMVAARYQDIGAERVTLLASPDGGALVRVIAGTLGDYDGPGVTHTPITMVHATIQPGAELRLPWRSDFNALAYVLSGHGRAGAEHRPVGSGQLAVFDRGDVVVLAAAPTQESRSPALEVLILGGRPIGETVAWYGPFVMNTQGELAQAFDDFRAGRMGTIPADHIGD